MGDEPITRRAGKPQVRKTRHDGLTVSKQQKFIDALALTCNVTKAAAFAGTNLTSVFRLRTRDAAFSARWQEALAMGYDRLETLMLEHGGAGRPMDPDPDAAETAGVDAKPFDFDKAIKILTFRRNQRDGRHRPVGRAPKNATREETNAALMKLLAAAKRRVETRLEAGPKAGPTRGEDA